MKKWRIHYDVQSPTGSVDIDSDSICGEEPNEDEIQHAIDEDVRINVVGVVDHVEELD